MRTSRTFTHDIAHRITMLLTETRRSERSRQKVLRQQIRDLGFFISDFTRQASGFTVQDFNDLVASGVIKLV